MVDTPTPPPTFDPMGDPLHPWAAGGVFHPIPELPREWAVPVAPFLRAVWDDPDDDTRRLALADWLDDRDLVPKRAELIRVGVRAAAFRADLFRRRVPYSDPDWAECIALFDREVQLIDPPDKTGVFSGWWDGPWKGWQLETAGRVLVVGAACLPRAVVKRGFVEEAWGALPCLLDEGIVREYPPNAEEGYGNDPPRRTPLPTHSNVSADGAIGVSFPLSSVVLRGVAPYLRDRDAWVFDFDREADGVQTPEAVRARLSGAAYRTEAEAVYDFSRAWAAVFRTRLDFGLRDDFLFSVFNPGGSGRKSLGRIAVSLAEAVRPRTGEWEVGEGLDLYEAADPDNQDWDDQDEEVLDNLTDEGVIGFPDPDFNDAEEGTTYEPGWD